jgi:hypothetical protein
VTTLVTTNSAATTSGVTDKTQTLDGVNSRLTNEEDRDLFGGSPSPSLTSPATPTTPTITRPTPDEILGKLFTTAALANRAAKELYITWYAQFCPDNERPHYGTYLPASGSKYEGMLGQTDRGLEARLEELGDEGLGVWEEELDMEGERKKEKLKVWVRQVGVLGPMN